jgi:hypothetical protein
MLALIMQVAALIGDVVGSREVPDRRLLQERLLSILAEVSERYGVPLDLTLGDEFQGRYPSLQHAIGASWFLHLASIGVARLRIGIGWGELLVEGSEDSPFGQDGPAWWRAREAVEAVEKSSQPVRTLVTTESPWDMFFNSFLHLRDTHLDDLDVTDARIVHGLIEGETQRSLAERLGLHESSVSRRVKRHLLSTLVDSATPDIPGFGS